MEGPLHYQTQLSDDSNLVLMVLVSLTVAVLVVLTVLLSYLQCYRLRQSAPKAGHSRTDSDSDYSSYQGDGEDEIQDTTFSEHSSVVSSVRRLLII